MTEHLFGRDRELAVIRRALTDTAAGAGGCHVLAGPAGIGKTRLLRAAGDLADELGIAVAAREAFPHDSAAPLITLAGALRGCGPPTGEFDWLSRPDRHDDPYLLLERLRASLETFASRRPLLVVIDDAHWMDELSALAFRELVPALESFPVRWIFATRASHPRPDPAWPDPTWPDPTWPDATRPDFAWPDASRPDRNWPERARTDATQSDRNWPDPARSDRPGTDPDWTGPTRTDTTRTDRNWPDPARDERPGADPDWTHPTWTDRAPAGPIAQRPGRAGQDRGGRRAAAGHRRTGYHRTGQDWGGQDWSGQDWAGTGWSGHLDGGHAGAGSNGSTGRDTLGWLARRGTETLFLDVLDDEAVSALCAEAVGSEVDNTVLALVGGCGGNPLRIEQLITALLRTGQLVISGGTATVVGGELPSSFVNTVRDILGSLSAGTRQLLQAGSVPTRPFGIEAAARLMHRDPAELFPLIDEATAAGLLVEDADGLSFAHDLVRQAVYSGLRRSVREQLHRDAALIDRDEHRPAREVAEHLLRGGRSGTAEAITMLREAAAEVAPLAPGTAADLLGHALEMTGPHDPQRPGLAAEAVGLLAAAARVAEARRLGDEALRWELAPPEEAALLLGLAEAAKHAGQNRASVEYADRALALTGVSPGVRAGLHAIRAHALIYVTGPARTGLPARGHPNSASFPGGPARANGGPAHAHDPTGTDRRSASPTGGDQDTDHRGFTPGGNPAVARRVAHHRSNSPRTNDPAGTDRSRARGPAEGANQQHSLRGHDPADLDNRSTRAHGRPDPTRFVEADGATGGDGTRHLRGPGPAHAGGPADAGSNWPGIGGPGGDPGGGAPSGGELSDGELSDGELNGSEPSGGPGGGLSYGGPGGGLSSDPGRPPGGGTPGSELSSGPPAGGPGGGPGGDTPGSELSSDPPAGGPGGGAPASGGSVGLDELIAADASGAEADRLGRLGNEHGAAVFGGTARALVAQAQGRLVDAYAHAAAATELADRTGGAARHRHPRIWLASALTSLDRFDDAAETLRRGRAESERLGTGWTQPVWHYYDAVLLTARGRLDEAVAEADAGVTIAEQGTAGQLAVPLLGLLVRLAVLRGDLDSAQSSLARVRRLTATGITAAPEDVLWPEAVLLAATGAADQAVASVAVLYDTMPARPALLAADPAAAGPLVALALAAGDRNRAELAARAARELAARNPGLCSAAAAAAHADGLLHADPVRLADAVEQFRRTPRPLALAAALEDAAVAGQDRDDPELVQARYAEALAVVTDCGARPAQRRLEQRLGRAGAGPPAAPTCLPQLSAAERNVALLVAEGLTNVEVASRLYLSRHTVDSHLRKIFTKLDIKRRVELARVVARECPGNHRIA